MGTATRMILALTVVALVATSALAVEGGNPRKGKYLFKKHCRICHVEGKSGGDLTPMAKTMAQWDRFFQEDKHQVKPEVMKGLSKKDVLDIWQFLYDHAADSPQPQTCG